MVLLSSLILAAWLMALVRTIVNLAAAPRLRDGAMPAVRPLVSVIIPARDEERMIERTLRAMLAQTYAALEIVVVDDRSVDATGTIVDRLAAEDARLVAVHNEEPPPGWLGKPWALHQGSLRARGELLLFVDADVLYEPGAIAAAVAHFQERRVALVSLMPSLGMRGFWEHIAMPNLAFFLFTIFPLWLSNRTRLPILGVGGGPGNLVGRTGYEAAGGHVALKDAVVDDVGLARLMRRTVGRTEVVRAEDLVSVRMYEGLGQVIEGFTKNGFAVTGRSYLIIFIATILGAVAHLLPYALAVTGNVLAIITVAVITLTRLILFRALRYRMDNALFGHPLMIALWGYILLRSTWYTGIRRRLLWRGRTYDAGKTRFGAD
jgi:glycosyltransferase involved in cell wall biosynthesis